MRLTGPILLAATIALAACSESAAESGAHPVDSEAITIESLPLAPGFYVSDQASCATASNATLLLMRKGGFNGSREPCSFSLIEQLSDSGYRVTQSCNTNGAAFGYEDEIYDSVTMIEITGPGSFSLTYEGGEPQGMIHCPQDSLPDPWRDNDIAELVAE